MNARMCRGYLGVFGSEIDTLARGYIATLTELRHEHDLKLKKGEYHITIASKPELQSLRSAGSLPSDDSNPLPGLAQLNDDLRRPSSSPITFGIGSNQKGVYWIAVVWAAGQKFRNQLGLPVKQFHITLTSTDEHEIDKASPTDMICFRRLDLTTHFSGTEHYLEGQSTSISLGDLVQNKEDYLSSFAYGLVAQNNISLAQSAAELLVISAPRAPRSFVCLGDVSVQRGLWKLVMLSFGCALDLHLNDLADEVNVKASRISAYCLRQLRRSADHTDWGAVFVDEELEELPTDPVVRECLSRPWSAALRLYLQSVYDNIEPSRRPNRTLESRVRVSTWQVVLSGNPETCDLPASDTQDDSSTHVQLVTRLVEHLAVEGQPPIAEPHVSSVTGTTERHPRMAKHVIRQYTLPRFFRWNAEDIEVLASPHVGIRHVITLTEESPLPEIWFEQPSTTCVRHTHISIPNYQPPTLEQMDLILRRICEPGGSPVLVHCGGGKGRAGTVAACYLAAFGFGPIPNRESNESTPAMSANEAIAALRLMRPGSLETIQQEDFVKSWVSTLWKRQTLLLPRIAEPLPSSLVTDGVVTPDADLLILCGLPGSGKSWFSQAIVRRGGIIGKSHEGSRNPAPIWRIISQDESGSRATCESDIGRAGLPGSRAILDRCNPTSDERREWLKLASWAQHPVCVWFDYDPQLCIDRAQNRTNHPTLPSGPRVRTAVASMRRSFQPPLKTWKSEGFQGLAHVTSFEAALELCQSLCPVGLLKFPRTTHLLNLGAATADDVVTESPVPSPLRSGERVVISEKIDGANIGFSLSTSRALLVQNRSHYVHSGDHAQFKALDSWIAKHRENLYAVLDRDTSFPERYILYGEWMAATHSIAYTALESLFYVFDLYDRASNTFASRAILEQTLANTNIELTPVLSIYDYIPTNEALAQMVQQESHFYPGPVEGIYVKVENDQVVRRRGKVVRGDFIAGNDHWTKGMIRWNVVLDSA
ncbi:hypothetical protein FRC07_008165 [Ceratobasidium sp. 392]|nr:hypothetical protein FRC07_008165 [Ceratobasidium sp. 392]